MLKYCSLYSGSTGNSFLVQSNNSNILIDAGVSSKKIVDALTSLNISMDQVNAILVTHEHIDHIKSLATISKKYNIPVYANQKTWNALGDLSNKISNDNKKTFNTFENFKVADFEIFPFNTPHDAAEPCGFNIYNSGKKISIATDLGCVTKELLEHIKNSSSILLEANYDPNILKCSRYPFLLKQRISSNIGHLSNNSAGKTLSYLYKLGLNQALLIHLSKENNFPELAYETVLSEFTEHKNISINVAPRDNPSRLFEVC